MKNNVKNMQNKSSKELITLLKEKRLALQTFRFAVAGSNMRNVKEGKTLKKDIARIMTFLNTEASYKIRKVTSL